MLWQYFCFARLRKCVRADDKTNGVKNRANLENICWRVKRDFTFQQDNIKQNARLTV